MGRPSQRERRRAELTSAFARVLAKHGYAGATVAAVAEEANVSPGLIHHHFADKEDLMESLLGELVGRFRLRIAALERGGDPLAAYTDAAVRLDASADLIAARCWVGVFAEAIRNPTLFAKVRRLLDTEIVGLQRRSGAKLSEHDASAILAFIVGALVLGAFAPKKTAGFAAPALRRFIATAQLPAGP